MNKFYITTAIPYVNAEPHLGFALEIIQTDVVARYHRVKGDDIFFLTGSDENSLKNVLAAKEQGITTKELVDENSKKFKELKEVLNLSWDDFIRTTEQRHRDGVQKFWLSCRREDIYKKKYEGLYCIDCEEFKTKKELVNNHCSEHPSAKLEAVAEENYFFKLSAYQERLERLIESGELKIVPATRRNEIVSFIKQGLEDFSISRSVKRAQRWGIPVPGDDTQIIYVWFDALTNYVTALGYAKNAECYKKYWETNDAIVHVVGKGISRFHAIYWPAMLLSAGLRLPKTIFIHGYLTIKGQKISKSLGNVIDPFELRKKYGVDPIRYYLLKEVPPWEDGDFTIERLKESYTADLANGLGNLVARFFGAAKKFGEIPIDRDEFKEYADEIFENYTESVEGFRFNDALSETFKLVKRLNQYFDEAKPWQFTELNEQSKLFFSTVALNLGKIASMFLPFLPETAERIFDYLGFNGKSKEPWKIVEMKKETEPLFKKLM